MSWQRNNVWRRLHDVSELRGLQDIEEGLLTDVDDILLADLVRYAVTDIEDV
jgi:hypothetical protein